MLPKSEKFSTTVDEPLAISAPLAYRLAPELCWKHPRTARGCAHYHSIWQTMRLLGLISSIRREDVFFLSQLYEIAANGQYRRVLIAGAADYALLARVFSAFSQAGQACDITVLDRCSSALYWNRWYAERFGFTIDVIKSDILDYRAAALFDIVCTHSFLGFFPPEQKPLLVKCLASKLRRGGKLITSQRVNEALQRDANTFDAQQIALMRQRALRAAERGQQHFGQAFTPQMIANAVADYARNYKRYPPRSHGALQKLFTAAGFSIDIYQTDANKTLDQPAGPIANRESARVNIVATC